MPLTTLFANLTDPTGPELDEDLAELGALTVIPCSVSGTNALTLTPLQPTPDRAAYANYNQWSGIAVATNTGVLQAAIGSLASLVVYKDLGAGPVVCDGGELVVGNAFTLIYDSALGGGTGGFHLVSSTSSTGLFLPLTGGVLSGPLLGGTISATIGNILGTLTATTILAQGSLSSVFMDNVSIATLTMSGSTSSIFAPNASLATLTSPLATVGNASVGTLTTAGLASLAKLEIGASSASITRILSVLSSITFTATPASSSQDQPVLLPGAQLNDSIDLGLPSISAPLFDGVGFVGYMAAAGTVNVRLINSAGASVSAATITVRATAMGFT